MSRHALELDFELPPVPTFCLHENTTFWQPMTCLIGWYKLHHKEREPTREAGDRMKEKKEITEKPHSPVIRQTTNESRGEMSEREDMIVWLSNNGGR